VLKRRAERDPVAPGPEKARIRKGKGRLFWAEACQLRREAEDKHPVDAARSEVKAGAARESFFSTRERKKTMTG